jgi:CopG family nickel-responsive transcriptional regulator
MKRRVARFSVSTAPELLHEFDQVTQNLGYDRSKAIQAAMRNYISDLRLREGFGQVAGALVLLYDHETVGLEEKLTNIQHEHQDVISSNMHIHLTGDVCLEIIAVNGNIKAIRELAQKIMVQRGVMQVRMAAVNP